MPNDKIKLPIKTLIVFGTGGIIPIALFNIAGQLMGLIGNISLGLSAFWLGAILLLPRLWDAVSDPVVGHWSDHLQSRWGRRRPFVLLGGIAVAVSFVLMWWIPGGEMVRGLFPSESAFQWFQLLYILLWLLIFFTACTLFEIPHGALGFEMTSDTHERTKLYSAKSFFGNTFAMGTPWLFAMANLEIFRGPGGSEADGMRYVSLLIAAVLIPLTIWWFKTLQEATATLPQAQQSLKRSFWQDMKLTTQNKHFVILVLVIFTLAMGFNFVSLLNYYITIFYLYAGDKVAAGTLLGINGTIWAVTGLLAVFPLNWLSPRLGKKKTLIFSIGLMVSAQLSKIVCYNPSYPYLVIIPTILLSSGMLFFFTLGSSMVGDICDEDDLRSGVRREGCFYSVYWWFVKMGTAFASFVTGLLIVFSQFDETQVVKTDNLKGRLNELQLSLESGENREESVKKIKAALSASEALQEHFKDSLDKLSASDLEQGRHLLQINESTRAVQTSLQNLLKSAQTDAKKSAQELLQALASVTNRLPALRQQTPLSLYRMRWVEISLPTLLSLVSLILAMKYPLDDRRCMEIGRELSLRNEKK